MWPFTSKLKKANILSHFIDFHCHLLPGVDDGIRRTADTLLVLHHYEEMGIKEVWFTPHIMEDVPNTTNHLRNRFEELKEKYQSSITLHLAAEYMLDNLFNERFNNDDLLLHGDAQDAVLVETSYVNGPLDLHDTLQKILSKGYFPLLAHPERYMYMDHDEYEELKDMGVRFQLNLPSLCGHYGEVVKNEAQWLLENEYYDLMGTDTHRASKLIGDFVIDRKNIKNIKQLLNI